MIDSEIDSAPVEDWAHDWDHTDPRWASDPYPIWDGLRATCPVAHTQRFNDGVWLPTRHEDVVAIARDAATFSSSHDGIHKGSATRLRVPPIHYDPPEHGLIRRVLLPAFSAAAIKELRPFTERLCSGLADAFPADRGDAAVDYAQHIPAFVIAEMLGIPPADGDRFRDWVRRVIERGADDPEGANAAHQEIIVYMHERIAAHRRAPGNDIIDVLLRAEIDGEPLDDDLITKLLVMLLLAGIDTTWNAIGSALWHLAVHADDRRRLVAEPELLPVAVEELLRAYAPVSVPRRVTQDTTLGGCPMSAGDMVMLAFPAANRDPAVFDSADTVVLDRQPNRHLTFGVGIHRCVGSHLARMEVTVAIEKWLERVPEFRLDESSPVVWSTGLFHGPRSLPILVGG